MEKVILYGVGKNINNFISIIRAAGDDVSLILDGSPDKQGMTISGISVCAPSEFENHKERIIISCMAFDSVRKTMSELGLESREVTFVDYLREKSASIGVKQGQVPANYKLRLIFDLYSVANWGGAEKWNYTMASYAKGYFADVEVSIFKSEQVYPSATGVDVINISSNRSFEDVVERIKLDANVVFLNSFNSDTFYGMLYAKLFVNHAIRIVNVVHNDLYAIYEQNLLYEPFIDSYLCVSRKIADTMVSKYGVNAEKVKVISQPIELQDIGWDDKPHGEVLHIGMASRITKEQKRCDRIPELIELLEKEDFEYQLEIAGEGDMYNDIKTFIERRGLDKKVIMHGRLSDSEMQEFWKRMDVFVNLSDFEGTSLSMLEAMSYMCVPIVTDVSGSADYIDCGVSGYIHSIGDLQGIVSSISRLADNRDALREMAHKAYESVSVKCGKREICKTIESVLLSGR